MIEFKYRPSYIGLLFFTPFSLLFTAGLLLELFKDPRDWDNVIMIFLATVLIQSTYKRLGSINKITTITKHDHSIIIETKNIFGVKSKEINTQSIKRVWIHKSSLNYIPTQTVIKYKTTQGETHQLIDIYGSGGSVKEDDTNRILNFLHQCDSHILFGYEGSTINNWLNKKLNFNKK